ncbi:imidazoleglycerol-phosphate dehydratase HisB [Spirochaeta lutea]|uniref:Imidazoleglycerol-phosphate dehydratase n=1 Tax=Spirochaeta lutea TaxID=1480694 RepID=A0A098QVP7_9SPIO|nr:imidazoleglycerol-phosphate dehydratase HisB [Spirochaeta lutea]KGE71468.1 imidazoleglycerol-phosphate dehydratase [Spirochaeta lutea]
MAEATRRVRIERNTKETQIDLTLTLDSRADQSFDMPLPYLAHMLNAMAFHGGFGLEITARGDIEVDPHHLVEDLGIVLGQAFHKALEEYGPVQRYGHAVIPMDDALGQATVDVCQRPYLVYRVTFPQEKSGSFDMFLFKEFFQGFANSARINLHLECPYGDNAHHMSEALFKSLGRALTQAYRPLQGSMSDMSTKGGL